MIVSGSVARKTKNSRGTVATSHEGSTRYELRTFSFPPSHFCPLDHAVPRVAISGWSGEERLTVWLHSQGLVA